MLASGPHSFLDVVLLLCVAFLPTVVWIILSAVWIAASGADRANHRVSRGKVILVLGVIAAVPQVLWLSWLV